MRESFGYEPPDEDSKEDYYSALERKENEQRRAVRINQLLDSFSPADKKILVLIGNGVSYRVIAKQFLISIGSITKIRKKFILQAAVIIEEINKNEEFDPIDIGVSRAE